MITIQTLNVMGLYVKLSVMYVVSYSVCDLSTKTNDCNFDLQSSKSFPYDLYSFPLWLRNGIYHDILVLLIEVCSFSYLDCPWQGTCKPVNSTWSHNCMTYRCDMNIQGGHYQWKIQPIEYGKSIYFHL